MKVFRNRVVLTLTTLVTGVLFLNMSFFLAEVSALKLTQNKKMVENIAKLVAGAASEEEKDAFGGNGSEDLKSATEIDLLLHHRTPLSDYLVLPQQLTYMASHGQKTLAGTRNTVIQPPEA
ncbi:hypothetical protein KK062_09770 [Fulvivirgaceae bacterium PWU5]|uniref:Uncharacterized protein n=1 Tax=Dawidia cretensis TaxID=2782350 RepID=A0AAP2DYF8_9BACT|nr:hypothetical protein [Dawidia cretensis]MBT1708513.1 hypothetical protein [Dawidia cretensis]